MDPPGVGQTTTFNNFASGGEHYTLNATSGCVYTVSMCGTSWDTQLTIFDETNADVAYNDDSSCGLASEVTFTATSTGAYTIQLNNYFCNTNFTVAEYFGVTLVSCAATGGCNDPSACNYNAGDTDATNCCYDDECITLTAGGGSWDGEISWTVTDGTGAQVAGGPANSPGGVEVCLPDGCYTVNYFDSFGDGWNGATFTVTNGGNTIFTGTLVGGFGGSEQFCIELIPPEPPCYETEDTGCPSIDAGADIIIPECPTPCENVTVTADVFESGGTESYRVCSIDYNPPYPFNVGTPVFVGADDLFSGFAGKASKLRNSALTSHAAHADAGVPLVGTRDASEKGREGREEGCRRQERRHKGGSRRACRSRPRRTRGARAADGRAAAAGLDGNEPALPRCAAARMG